MSLNMQPSQLSEPIYMTCFRAIACCLLVVTASGCAAIGARENDGAGHYFAGVSDDCYYFAHPAEADYPELQPLNLVNLPFSFAVDLVGWPYDFEVNHTKRSPKPPGVF